MSQSANVRSVEAIQDFKITLITFGEDARNALSGVDMDIRHTRNWLERDQMAYWKGQVKHRQEQVSMARTELHRRRLSQANSDAISDTDQKEALKLAQRRLVEAEEKLEKVKRWVPILQHAISEYHSHSQPIGDRLSGPFESSLALIDRMVAALDSYLALAPPSMPSPSHSQGTGPEVVGSAAAGTPAAVATPAEPKKEEAAAEPVGAQEVQAEAEALGAVAERAEV